MPVQPFPMSPVMSIDKTRLAPSPTGALHLGNARTFLVTWALARQSGWRIVLRIEDLDGPRIKAGAANEAIDILAWLGLDWDEGPYYQSFDLTPYRKALERLAVQGDLYPCHCTRSQIESAPLSAPHGGKHETRYPGTCRPEVPARSTAKSLEYAGAALRYRVAEGAVMFSDRMIGQRTVNVSCTVGDFIVRTKEGLPSYQLAVVVDDARQGINAVVRGDDLLSSTGRQILLIDSLNVGPPPAYVHLPLVVGTDGRRLARRHGDSRVSHFRRHGVAADRIIGLLAEWCGIAERRPLSAQEFLKRFDLASVPRHPIVYHAMADDAWLTE